MNVLILIRVYQHMNQHAHRVMVGIYVSLVSSIKIPGIQRLKPKYAVNVLSIGEMPFN